ncbi:hypothetical protein L596_027840 [Steinernema carpocapsae]|uniref:Uncharacterized protein n=1 Tax=Steinernema carpocapsae TaxID=34508 RepID=A0A4U5LWN6_STECR|nr:hypothetical protein L596_027840 [Steinernema carpocapsae]
MAVLRLDAFAQCNSLFTSSNPAFSCTSNSHRTLHFAHTHTYPRLPQTICNHPTTRSRSPACYSYSIFRFYAFPDQTLDQDLLLDLPWFAHQQLHSYP